MVITVAFIGYLVAGLGGATAAALPVYLAVVVLAPSYKLWAKNPQLNARHLCWRHRRAVGVLVARRSVYDLPTILICLLSLGILFRWRIPEPVLIACAAVAGLLLHYA